MAKWADFVITAVKYNASRTHIEEVEAHKDIGDQLEAGKRYSRQTVVNAIKNGTTFVTAYRENGQFKMGAHVGIVTINGVEYLRTDRDSTPRDNLGSLPEIARAA